MPTDSPGSGVRKMSAFVRISRILFLVVTCCSGAFADTYPGGFPPARKASEGITSVDPIKPKSILENRELPRLSLLTPNLKDYNQGNSTRNPEPFGLPATDALPNEMTEKWAELQARILAEEKTFEACRLDDGLCPPSARRFLSIVELGRQRQGRAQLGWINRAVNLSIKPASDSAQYGVDDFWASPLATLSRGAGDCEDYAIVKYVALLKIGIEPDDLRLVIVHDNKNQATHAVTAVRHEEEWWILDNRTFILMNAGQVRQYYPLFTLDSRGVRTLITAAASR
jgi:predicted transglutaminase-like cysteine proteinase